MQTHVEPEIREAREALAADDPVRLQAAWQRLAVRYTQRAMPFSALAHDALDHHFPLSERRSLGLTLSRP